MPWPLAPALLLILSGCSAFPDIPAGGSLAQVNTFGATGSGIPEFTLMDVALDGQGRQFAPDPRNSRILIFEFLGQVEGTPWTIDGMARPEDIAIDASGNIYVTSSQSREIMVFSPSLQLVTRWGARAGDPGLRFPTDVAVGSGGTVYILENDPSAVIKMYAADGSFLGRIENAGDDDQYVSPTCIAVDAAGYLHAGYQEALGVGGVRRFSPEGIFLSKYILSGGSYVPTVIAIGPADQRVYVGDWRGLVTRLNNDGTPSAQWGRDTNGVSYLLRPEGLAIGSDGTVYVSDSVFSGLYRFSSSGPLVSVIEPLIQELKVTLVKGLDIDRSGFVYTIDQQLNRLQIYTDRGSFVKSWARAGRRAGYVYLPQDVAIDGLGSIYVADRDNARVQVFDETGRSIRTWSHPGITSVAANSNSVYTMANREIRRYTRDGTLRKSISAIDGKSFTTLEALALDPENRLYVADGGDGKIHVLTDSLTLVRSMDFLSRRDVFDNIDIAIDSQSRVYIAINQENLIQILDSDGTLLRNWNPFPPGNGPTAIAIDRRTDHVYIARSSGPMYEFTGIDED